MPRKVQGRLRKLTFEDRQRKLERDGRRGRKVVFTEKGAFKVKKLKEESDGQN